MRWMMIGLLVSLGALLIAAAGVAIHIRIQHAKFKREPLSRIDAPGTDPEP
jgi:hypothetical protein